MLIKDVFGNFGDEESTLEVSIEKISYQGENLYKMKKHYGNLTKKEFIDAQKRSLE